MKILVLGRNSLLFALCIFAPYIVRADDAHPCFSDRAPASRLECLERNLKGADQLLRQKHTNLISAVEKSKVWSTSQSMSSIYKEQTLASIRNADKHWRALMKSECDLEGLNYFGGSVQDSMVLTCQIFRTYERIKHIGNSEAYRSHWENQ